MQRTAPATVEKQAVVKQGGGFAHDDEERLTSGFMRHGLGSFSRFWPKLPKLVDAWFVVQTISQQTGIASAFPE
jgi:hypothetical protein